MFNLCLSFNAHKLLITFLLDIVLFFMSDFMQITEYSVNVILKLRIMFPDM